MKTTQLNEKQIARWSRDWLAEGAAKGFLISETSITLAPEPERFPALLCEVCGEVLVGSMPEEGRDEIIESLTGETIFYTDHQRVCSDCYENDPVEASYVKADYYR